MGHNFRDMCNKLGGSTSSVASLPHGGIPSKWDKTSTKPQPFSFDERDKQKMQKKQEMIQKVRQWQSYNAYKMEKFDYFAFYDFLWCSCHILQGNIGGKKKVVWNLHEHAGVSYVKYKNEQHK